MDHLNCQLFQLDQDSQSDLPSSLRDKLSEDEDLNFLESSELFKFDSKTNQDFLREQKIQNILRKIVQSKEQLEYILEVDSTSELSNANRSKRMSAKFSKIFCSKSSLNGDKQIQLVRNTSTSKYTHYWNESKVLDSSVRISLNSRQQFIKKENCSTDQQEYKENKNPLNFPQNFNENQVKSLYYLDEDKKQIKRNQNCLKLVERNISQTPDILSNNEDDDQNNQIEIIQFSNRNKKRLKNQRSPSSNNGKILRKQKFKNKKVFNNLKTNSKMNKTLQPKSSKRQYKNIKKKLTKKNSLQKIKTEIKNGELNGTKLNSLSYSKFKPFQSQNFKNFCLDQFNINSRTLSTKNKKKATKAKLISQGKLKLKSSKMNLLNSKTKFLKN